jgi:nitric oxide reductase NorQ protein
VAGEVALFEHAWRHRMPLLLKGPTGCGKTRFVEHMAWRLGLPLVTVACNEDMTAADLTGRHLLDAGGTVWQDGPLTLAVRHGGICYLDEVIEAHADTTVAIHPLADARRILPLERNGELLHAHPDFLLVASYNPGYRGRGKGLKPSTRQRFASFVFGYPAAEVEAAVVVHESGVDSAMAARLVELAGRTRVLADDGLDEGASTRMLIHAGRLIAGGVAPLDAARMAVTQPLSDDPEIEVSLHALADACMG